MPKQVVKRQKSTSTRARAVLPDLTLNELRILHKVHYHTIGDAEAYVDARVVTDEITDEHGVQGFDEFTKLYEKGLVVSRPKQALTNHFRLSEPTMRCIDSLYEQLNRKEAAAGLSPTAEPVLEEEGAVSASDAREIPEATEPTAAPLNKVRRSRTRKPKAEAPATSA